MLESDPSVFGRLLAVLATDGDAQRLFGFLVCNFLLIVAELLYGLSSLKIGMLFFSNATVHNNFKALST